MKKISSEALYEAMEGIGEDLLLRSEEESARAPGKRRPRRLSPRVITGIAAAAALLLIAVLAQSTLRLSGGTSSAPDSVSGQAAAALEEAAEEEAAEADAAEEAGIAAVHADAPAEDGGIAAADALPKAADSMTMGASPEKAEPVTPAYGAGGENGQYEEAEADKETENKGRTAPAFFAYHGIRYEEKTDPRNTADTVPVGDFVTHVAEGDVYTVTGEDPEKVLCIPGHDGTVRIFFAEEQ